MKNKPVIFKCMYNSYQKNLKKTENKTVIKESIKKV